MSAVWLATWTGLRARWRAWLVLALLTGLIGGLVTAVAAGARRTDAAYPALAAWSQAPDDLVALGFGGQFASVPAATLERFPQVTQVASLTTFTVLSPASVTVMAPASAAIPGAFWHRKLLAGRLPDPAAPREADISFTVAQAEHVGVGGTLPANLLGANGKPVPFGFRVVGIDAAPSEFPPQYGTGIDVVWATAAFTRAHGGQLARTPSVAVRLRHGAADVAALDKWIAQRGGGKPVSDFPLGPVNANTQHSIHLQAITLWVLAGLLAVTGLLILAQLLARFTALESGGHDTLRALGMTPAGLLGAGLARACLIGAAGGALAAALAACLSPLFPFGLARIAEPHPGVAADWLALGLGFLAVLAATVGCAAWPSWRAARPARAAAAPRAPAWSAAARAALPVPVAMGARLALRRGTGRAAVPVRATVTASAVGVLGLATALVFTSSLDHLLGTPRMYGVAWDATVANVQNASVAPAAQAIARDPAVARQAGIYPGVPLLLSAAGPATRAAQGPSAAAAGQRRAVEVGAIVLGDADPGPSGGLAVVPLAGRAPRGAGDIVLGQRTLDALGAHVGDTIRVSVAGLGAPAYRTIVGTAVFPSVSDQTGLGAGAEMTMASVRAMAPPGASLPPYTAIIVRFRPGVAPQQGISELATRLEARGAYAVIPAATPADLINFGQLQDLPLLLGLALGALALLTIAHLLLTSVRRRRRDLAVLRAVGLTPRQARATVAWMGITVAASALAVGVPAGIVCGRLAWRAFAGQLGIQAVTVTPPGWLALTAFAALALSVAVAAIPARVASRAKPAQVLREE